MQLSVGARRFRRARWVVLLVLGAGALPACTPASKAVGGQGSTAACAGVAPGAKPGGGTWTCTFDDEFNGTRIDGTKWFVQTTARSGFHVGAECFVANPANVSEADGVLSLTVRRAATPFNCATPSGSYQSQYTSGTVNTLDRFSQTYGRFEIRARFPATTVAGLQATLWLWPTTAKYGNWPTNGEIDIAEAFSQHPDRVIPYVHYTPASADPDSTDNFCFLDPGQFHTYAAVWTPATITIQFDGRTCIADSWKPAPPLVKPAPFDQPFMVALTQALGVGANAVRAATPLPATTQVDYVRVWS